MGLVPTVLVSPGEVSPSRVVFWENIWGLVWRWFLSAISNPLT